MNYQKFTIEILNEPDYTIGSTDNIFSYSKLYFGKDALEYSNSTKHGVKIYHNGQIVNSCMVMGSGGATAVHQNSTLLDEDHLLFVAVTLSSALRFPNSN